MIHFCGANCRKLPIHCASVLRYPVLVGGCANLCAGFTSNASFALWFTEPAVPLTVTLALTDEAVARAVRLMVCCAPLERLNWVVEALTPAGTPLMLMLTLGADPLTLTVMLLDAPGVNATTPGCTIRLKSVMLPPPPPPPVLEPPPPQPVRADRKKTARKKRAGSTRLIIRISRLLADYNLIHCHRMVRAL